MKVYEFITHEKAMRIAAIDEEFHPIDYSFDGRSLQDVWTPVEIETLYKKRYSDFPHYINGKPMVSEKVKNIIMPYVASEVEFLPLLHRELQLYMINVINVLDCVDWKRSDVRRNEDGSFYRFNNLVFDFMKIPDKTYIFKLKELSKTRVYITDAFKDLIERNKLKGLDFSIVYDSDFTEEKEREQRENYAEALAAIESNKGQEISYQEARDQVNQNKAFASGKWKIQINARGEFCLGELLQDLSYQWIIPIYIPPVLLGYQWHEVEKSEI